MNRTRPIITTLLGLSLTMIIFSCASFTPAPSYNISENYDAGKINKIGILVVRMGNIFPSQTLPLKPSTDFSKSTPKYGWHGKISDKTQNVYIEDESRLKKSFPFYPATSNKRIRFLTDQYSFEFYKNFSPEIYVMLSDIFRAKGYETINIAEIAQNWDKPVSESTIAEIIDKSKDFIDTLAIFQYLDIGTSSLRIGSAASKRQGFINFEYSLYMFDTISQEVIFDYNKDFPGATIHALMNDPFITENQEYKEKVKRFEKGFGRWETLYFVNDLPEKVSSERLMEYIKNGTQINTKNYGLMRWTGLMEVIPGK